MKELPIKRWTVVLTVLFIAPFIIYYVSFCWFHWFSSDPTNWGVFGDFIGGLLNPFFAALNVVAFIYLTNRISGVENERDRINRRFQRDLAINDIRQNALKEFTFVKNKFIERVDSDDDLVTIRKIKKYVLFYHSEVESLIVQYDHVFKKTFADSKFRSVLQENMKIIEDLQEKLENSDKISEAGNGILVNHSKLMQELQEEVQHGWDDHENKK